MVIVLGVTLGFVDLMYIIQHTQEGMKDSKKNDCSLNDISCNMMYNKQGKTQENFEGKYGFMNDISGNKQPFTNRRRENFENDISGNKQPFTNRPRENFDDETSESVTQDKVTGTSLNTIKIDAKKMGNILEKIKGTELGNAFNMKEGVDMTNGVNMTELNKLVTKLNNIVDTFS